MISNKVILNTMTGIRLAGEVVNHLAKEAWEQFRKQNRVTSFFENKRSEGPARASKSSKGHKPGDKRQPKHEEIWVPKIMLDMMMATTANSTSVHFGMNH